MPALTSLFVMPVLAGLAAAPPGPVVELKPVTRTVALTAEDARDVLQVRVASKRSTWLVLPSDVEGPVARRRELGAVEVLGNLVTLAPAAPLGPGRRVPLRLQLASGPALLFEVLGAGEEYDERVTVTLARPELAASPAAAPAAPAPAPPGSIERLEEKLEQCRQELADAHGPAAAKEVLTGLVAASGDKAPALVRRQLGRHFEESFVWVGLRQSYHLFDWVFVVLDVDNRQAGTKWILGSVAVRQAGGGEPLPASVQNSRPQGIAAGERARVVIGFPVPADNTRRYVLTLTDKAGSRNVVLKDLDL